VPDRIADVAIRHCRPEDLVAVLSIHTQQGNRPEGPPTEIESVTWALMTERPGLTVYLAELRGRPIGTASMMLMPNLTYACAPTAFIEGVVVVAGHRRLGVATAMLRTALTDATRAGVDKVQLLAHKRHAVDGAHALYAGLGFTAEAEGFRRYLKTPDVDRTR
jgi:GNAT superfamily N-acetyltransferase